MIGLDDMSEVELSGIRTELLTEEGGIHRNLIAHKTVLQKKQSIREKLQGRVQTLKGILRREIHSNVTDLNKVSQSKVALEDTQLLLDKTESSITQLQDSIDVLEGSLDKLKSKLGLIDQAIEKRKNPPVGKVIQFDGYRSKKENLG